jgi:prophage endopeptidase
MNRTELTLAIAAILLGAVILGWILRWFTSRLAAGAPVNPDSMAARLHEAELAKEAAIQRLADSERSYANLLTQAYAERDSAMETIGHMRREIDALRGAQ